MEVKLSRKEWKENINMIKVIENTEDRETAKCILLTDSCIIDYFYNTMHRRPPFGCPPTTCRECYSKFRKAIIKESKKYYKNNNLNWE